MQGLLLPPIFTVTVAYIGDEWPPRRRASRRRALYSGIEHRRIFRPLHPRHFNRCDRLAAAIQVVALLTLVAAIIVSLTLTRERKFVRSGGLAASLRQMLRHLRDRRLIATYRDRLRRAVQLHCHVHLCELPSRGTALSFLADPARGTIFHLSRLQSAVPWVGRAIALFGRRPFVLGIIALWIVGALLLLAPPVRIIIAGLTLCAVCGMLCQAVSTGYVTMTAREGRSSAVGLYASVFYIGGSAGAFFTGLAWSSAGWNGCVALIVAMQVVMAVIVALAWD